MEENPRKGLMTSSTSWSIFDLNGISSYQRIEPVYDSMNQKQDKRVGITIKDTDKTITIDWTALRDWKLGYFSDYIGIKAIIPYDVLQLKQPIGENSELRLWSYEETNAGVAVINSTDYEILKRMYYDGRPGSFSILFKSGDCPVFHFDDTENLKYYLGN